VTEEPDAPPPRPRSLVALVAALFVGAVIGAAAAISFMRQQPPPTPDAPAQAPVAAAKPDTTVDYTPVAVESLPGWEEESIADALPALHRSCGRLQAQAADRVIGTGSIARPASAWHTACDAILRVTSGDAALRAALTDNFVAYRVSNGSGEPGSEHGLFTGYYEAELRGSLEQGGTNQYPIYGVPRDLVSVDVRDFVTAANVPSGVPTSIVGRVVDSGRGLRMSPYFTRAQIDAERAIASSADVLVWVDDPVAVHILHIQGSGRVTLSDGSVMRIGFAGSNGRQFKGIGSILLEAGQLKPGGASMIAVRDWLRAHPDEAAKYMNLNTRYIFFRKLAPSETEDGPVGASNVSLTPGRSLAVDPRYIPYGAPLWLDTKDPDEIPIQRLVVAQDTGAAITGPVRGDYFWGYGEEAFMKAARMKSTGGYVIFVPKAPESLSSPVPPPIEPAEHQSEDPDAGEPGKIPR
jgi:membrane-bound lytic murein transglycosylase A